MKEKNNALINCRLFHNMDVSDINKITMSSYAASVQYKKGTQVFCVGDSIYKMYILISGRVAITRTTFSGRRVVITDIWQQGDMFGEVYLFMGKTSYDMSAEVIADAQILSLDKKIFQEPGYEKLQTNLIAVFANKAFILSSKVRLLGCGTIREKIAHYLVACQDLSGQITNQLSREDMADMLNVARPSLSRELGKMAVEGIIQIERRKIIVIDQNKLEEYL